MMNDNSDHYLEHPEQEQWEKYSPSKYLKRIKWLLAISFVLILVVFARVGGIGGVRAAIAVILVLGLGIVFWAYFKVGWFCPGCGLMVTADKLKCECGKEVPPQLHN